MTGGRHTETAKREGIIKIERESQGDIGEETKGRKIQRRKEIHSEKEREEEKEERERDREEREGEERARPESFDKSRSVSSRVSTFE